jgi:hypothetical protein
VALGERGSQLAEELDHSVAALSACLESGLHLVKAGARSDEVSVVLGKGRSQVARARELVAYLRDFLRGSRER